MAVKKAKEPIRLRQRKIKGGNISLYLDIYVGGQRSYEYLKLYLIPEKTREDKQTNADTLALANAIKSKRIVELQNDAHGFAKRSRHDVRLLEYIKICIADKRCNTNNFSTLINHISQFEKNQNITIGQIDRKWGERFIKYLTNVASNFCKREDSLSINTCIQYAKKVSLVLNLAVKDGIIEKNPLAGMEYPKAKQSTRMYLTIEEVRQLSQTYIYNEEIKRMFLFACLTGLRMCDVKNLRGEDVTEQGEYTRIIFRQQKTKEQEYLDISPQAVEMLGDFKRDSTPIFQDYSNTYINYALAKWVARAGIKKHITYHCARHTFATMMLDLGTDLYTVSKLLGHTDISTTQIYTKVIDKNKQKAVMSIPDLIHKSEQ